MGSHKNQRAYQIIVLINFFHFLISLRPRSKMPKVNTNRTPAQNRLRNAQRRAATESAARARQAAAAAAEKVKEALRGSSPVRHGEGRNKGKCRYVRA